ncbi:hypothetical protein BJ878DRAFT_538885 [Calycina marina]|uniref:Uncharacterized protein n=1 Tax=Calycina marina TaxID=1763456 RepID=A0A9P8CJT8_9HELO|nr:hypothetical protein BJ878DRAFT_538885 [Calycina marina]
MGRDKRDKPKLVIELPKQTLTNPKCLTVRASATCPQLATSNASRKDLATMQSYGATNLLARVASYSSAQQENVMNSKHSPCSSAGQSPESANMDAKEPFDVEIRQSAGNYFSFPSFEDFLKYEEEARIDGRQEKGIP